MFTFPAFTCIPADFLQLREKKNWTGRKGSPLVMDEQDPQAIFGFTHMSQMFCFSEDQVLAHKHIVSVIRT